MQIFGLILCPIEFDSIGAVRKTTGAWHRKFHVVIVSAGHGTGEEVTSRADTEVEYKGGALAVPFGGKQ